MIPEQQLSEHFSLYELTRTDHAEFLERNRIVSDQQILKLKFLATLLEQVRTILAAPLSVHSGYRCIDLNRAIGSGDSSQHPKCEAADFSPKGVVLLDAFKTIVKAAKHNEIKFGQLIYEKAGRSYGAAEWIHISLGDPYRAASQCGQVLTMVDGKYELIDTV